MDRNTMEQQLIQNYRFLHTIPEIGLKEYQTTQFLEQCIRGIQGVQIYGENQNGKEEGEEQLKAGIIAVVRSPNKKQPKKAFLFRADIDALPFTQDSGVQFSSKNGLHHACGHDAHASMLLSALKLIASRKQQLQRDIYFCFQPGEEGCAGASKLLKKFPKLLEDVEHCFGLHVGNHKEKGTLLWAKNYVTSNTNRFTIKIKGKSVHSMLPHLGVDANYIGCSIVTEIYAIRNRMTDPSKGMTISVTKISCGNQNPSSISQNFQFTGSVRSFDPFDHKKVVEYIEKFSKSFCEINGATCQFSISPSCYRAVFNDETALKIVKTESQKIFKKVQQMPPSCSGEDFCEFSQKRPSCYFVLGVALPGSIDPQTKESIFPIHSNKFKLDQTALWNGALLWERIAFAKN